MKTVYVKAPGEFQFREEPLPAPGARQVLVEVAYCGICGSDVTLARKEARDWTALGHEVSGVVREVGPGVTHVRAGDPVALDCGNNCGVCPECRAGRPRRCTALLGFYGTRSGYGDFLLAEAQNVHPIGDLALRTACLLEPFGVAMNLFTCLEIDFLDDVLLIGPGPIGLLALATCRARGARSLTAWGRSPGARLDYARRLGAETAVLRDQQPGAGEDRFDKVILTAPPDLLPLAVRACRTNGIIA